jgi:hypothetical protein
LSENVGLELFEVLAWCNRTLRFKLAKQVERDISFNFATLAPLISPPQMLLKLSCSFVFWTIAAALNIQSLEQVNYLQVHNKTNKSIKNLLIT